MCLLCIWSPVPFPWCFLQTDWCLVERSKVPCACMSWQREAQELQYCLRKSFSWKANTFCCWRVFIGSSATGQVKDGGEVCSFPLGRQCQGMTVVRLRAWLYGKTGERPKRKVRFYCCCCFLRNMKSPCISDLSVKPLLVFPVSPLTVIKWMYRNIGQHPWRLLWCVIERMSVLRDMMELTFSP